MIVVGVVVVVIVVVVRLASAVVVILDSFILVSLLFLADKRAVSGRQGVVMVGAAGKAKGETKMGACADDNGDRRDGVEDPSIPPPTAAAAGEGTLNAVLNSLSIDSYVLSDQPEPAVPVDEMLPALLRLE
jgi:hypothetical protein